MPAKGISIPDLRKNLHCLVVGQLASTNNLIFINELRIAEFGQQNAFCTSNGASQEQSNNSKARMCTRKCPSSAGNGESIHSLTGTKTEETLLLRRNYLQWGQWQFISFQRGEIGNDHAC